MFDFLSEGCINFNAITINELNILDFKWYKNITKVDQKCTYLKLYLT